MKYHLFIDESGDPSLSSINSDFPVFNLLGCLFDDLAYSKICVEVENLKKEFFGTENTILHNRDIRKCEGVFAKLFDLEIKAQFYRKLNRILEDGMYTIISVAIKTRIYRKIWENCR